MAATRLASTLRPYAAASPGSSPTPVRASLSVTAAICRLPPVTGQQLGQQRPRLARAGETDGLHSQGHRRGNVIGLVVNEDHFRGRDSQDGQGAGEALGGRLARFQLTAENQMLEVPGNRESGNRLSDLNGRIDRK